MIIGNESFDFGLATCSSIKNKSTFVSKYNRGGYI